MTNVVSIQGLSKRFGRIQALNNVSFDVPSHSIFGLLGPNGAGKTTLFSIIADFLKADTGIIEVLGIDTTNIRKLRGRLSILPQDARFQRNVPILEQLVFFRLLAGRTKQQAREEVIKSLELVGLQSFAKRRVGSLSHGMVKRLEIAQAFLGSPEVILLDEPTAGLDPAASRQIRDLVKQLQESATIIVSSHNLDEIQELCDHVAILNLGNLVLSGSVDEITLADREYNMTMSRPLQNNELELISSIEGVRSIQMQHQAGAGQGKGSAEYLVKLNLSAKNVNQDSVLSAILRGLLDMNVTPRKITEGRSLESQFLELTGGQNNNP
ncbi:MAG: ATP-binding cassette domain-containing protein [Phycisphaerae bacterium]|nr:ABC transporter ATP-binding protein [Phycisphaerae bacterium]NIP50873.1 ABC transporter ATP-binding protein [Phycisphaerae bacterium]NIS54744.1 ABC transporter ATP-binding protein [Phycisphaerae bacterium]NIU12344.1 ABC transporter ATP-binding protein [Phycisphaerae bacterium]NIU60233.1 ATP-binding cassette domain-containing protein [Phycisphaerae bacterium]